MLSLYAKDSMVDFLVQKLDYKIRCALTPFPVAKEYKAHLDTLNRDGCVVFEEYFSPEQVDEFLEDIEAAKKRQDLTRVANGHIDTGISRVYDVADVAPMTRKIFEDPMILSLIKGYCSSKCELLKTFYEEKREVGTSSQSNHHHFDDWRHRIKVWVYLTDVTENQAPTTITLGSHKNHLWRYWPEYNYFLHFRTDENNRYTEMTDYSGMFWPHEAATIRKLWKYKEKTITGKKGTMFIFDSRALHRSTVLKEGERKIITGYYTYKGLGL
ncbi:probable deoxygenase [Hahella chejuensis KCTC 2396]|uniref:Probable deoxygenase n=1 Tax=Hahella chejuensis (strain KCTC 2396) TaxID=349521 RepID=Q2SG45_HAHCH|nr:phytanoyl-CoA dioxygenase family protein [Hahella chejuensis]ABC30379.1 probable deoxygenase [Hahella chejuensis KCTC 2396]